MIKLKVIKKETQKKVTSIGNSKRSRPKNKSKRRCWKRYKGQGRK
tara:strand:- start:86 stop:220 length:135 start_codon:yes stop_codon:yes gene_type:complete